LRRSVPYLTICCVAAGGLLLELAQTRILSTLYFNHVVYLTVTVALLGFGSAGVALALMARRGRDPGRLLTPALAAFAVSSLLCPALASRTPTLETASTFARLTLCYLLLAVPFLCAGAAIGLLLMRHARQVFSLYAADLAASAVGVLAFSFLLRPLGAAGLLWTVGGLAVCALAAQALDGRAPRSLAAALAGALLLGALLVGDRLLGERPQDVKLTARAFEAGTRTRIEATEWTPLARIDVLHDPTSDVLSRAPAGPDGSRVITQDGSAHTALLGPREATRIASGAMRARPNADNLGYALRPEAENVLVIGVGGGKDIVMARGFGSRRIVGVELNEATVELLQGRYRSWALWPDWPGVELVRAEGRQYVRRAEQRFDVIVLSGVDTFSALSSGAYVLSENYLYTVEGIGDLLDALEPDGVLVIYRWLFPQPRETLRLANLFVEAAERRRMHSPEAAILVVAEDLGWLPWGATLMKRQAFTAAEVGPLLAAVERHPRQDVVYLPPVLPAEQTAAWERSAAAGAPQLEPARRAFAGLLGAGSPAARRAFEEAYPFAVEPVTDDRPFFFEYGKVPSLRTLLWADLDELRGAGVYLSLLLLLVMTVGAGVLGMLVPLAVFAREGLRVPGAGGLVAFFTCLGAGFMLLEIGLMQRLNLYLGDPTRSLSVVLAGILAATGAGSLLARRWRSPLAALRASTLAAAALAFAAVWLLPAVLDATFTWPLPARVALVLAGLLPLGLALGVPFATGLSVVQQRAARFVPWAWGVNGLASVAGSVLAIALAMRLGFAAILAIGACTYVGAALVAGKLFAAAGNGAAMGQNPQP
jgi:SAM-dependent methyltransferase